MSELHDENEQLKSQLEFSDQKAKKLENSNDNISKLFDNCLNANFDGPDYLDIDNKIENGSDNEKNNIFVILSQYKNKNCCRDAPEFWYRFASGQYFDVVYKYAKDTDEKAKARLEMPRALESAVKALDLASSNKSTRIYFEALKWYFVFTVKY